MSHFESIAELACTAVNEDDLSTADEVKVYQDEGDAENKSPENLSEDKEGLVEQSEESSSDAIKPTVISFTTEAKVEKSPHPVISYVPALYNGMQIGILPTLDNIKSSSGANISFPNFGISSTAGNNRLPTSSALGPLCDIPQWPVGSYFSMPGLSDPLIQSFGIGSMMGGFSASSLLPVGGALPPFGNHGIYTSRSQPYSINLSDQLRPWDIIGENKPRKPHIKKPLNAFMLFMKEQRGSVVNECTLKESAAINQILGRKWHELERDEQSKYYEMARQERLKHMELYPDWSARDNYGLRKRRRKKREKVPGENGELARKCRARYGINQIDLWCKPCRRKKKCVRFQTSDDGGSVDSESMIADIINCESLDGNDESHCLDEEEACL